ncbi:MAG: hypothetical protein K2X34_07485 [Hyphomonadaceae bacterium]|nr:hypothetical protein [Hyphomonadaceae bacterium]
MIRGSHLSLLAASRLYTPLIVLLALVSLFARPPGEGAGFISGVVLAMALVAHVLVFGTAQARRALPPFVARALLGAGLIAIAASALGAGGAWAAQVGEAGLLLVTAAGLHLIFTVLFGRAPTLRDGDAR